MSAPEAHPVFNHIGLYEGIGGFSLAARWAGWETIAWCEWDPYCQAVLKKHFPEAEAHGDITKTTFTKYAGQTDVLTAGFPCQPVSTAGKRKGTDDDRWGWPETRRAYRECRPNCIVLENVSGLFSILEPGSITEMERKEIGLFCDDQEYKANTTVERVQQRVIARIIQEIEQDGYILPRTKEGSPIVLCVPACAVGAPHRRDRVWIVAYAEITNDRRNAGAVSGKNGRQKRHNFSKFSGADELPGKVTTDTYSGGRRRREDNQGEKQARGGRIEKADQITADNQRIGMEGCQLFPIQNRETPIFGRRNDAWRNVANANQFNGNFSGHGTGPFSFDKATYLSGRGTYSNPNGSGREERNHASKPGLEGFSPRHVDTKWDEHWLQVATRICRVDDGVPGGLDGTGRIPGKPKDKKSSGRSHRLKALGNAIVPEIAYEIFKAIQSSLFNQE